MNEREREVLSEFIELYKALPCLWDISSEVYKDRNHKNDAWVTLVEKLKEIEEDANIASAKKKIENLKTAYKREVKKVEESKKRNGSSTNKIHKPNLWYFELMSFLDKKDEEQRIGIDTIMSDDESHSEQKQPKFTQKRKRSERVMEERQLKLIDTAQKLLEHNTLKTNAFAMYIGEQLEKISTQQRHIAEKLIADVIFLAKTDNLNLDSRVETSSKSRTFPAFHSPSPQYICVPSTQLIKSSPPCQSHSGSPVIKQSPSTQSSPQYDVYNYPPNIQPTSSPQFQPVSISSHPINPHSECQSPPSSEQTNQYSEIVEVPILLPSSPSVVVQCDEINCNNNFAAGSSSAPTGGLLKELLISKKYKQ